jgi:uncharacterized protein YoaH (UPF0181 family)
VFAVKSRASSADLERIEDFLAAGLSTARAIW